MSFPEMEPRERGEAVAMGGGEQETQFWKDKQKPDSLSRMIEGGVEGSLQSS